MSIMARTSGEGAHPRVGGENKDALAAVKGTAGSSPRGRGKRQQDVTVQDLEGLIPAWAGKTFSPAASISAARAHPRVGGENTACSAGRAHVMGSSPRGRGKRDNTQQFFPHFGLIPAWAGKTKRAVSRGILARAHPRVGGENTVKSSPTSSLRGSSPRGRGKRFPGDTDLAAFGLIPAWAGKTRT